MYALKSSRATTPLEIGRSLAMRPAKPGMALGVACKEDVAATLGESIAVPAEKARKQQFTSQQSTHVTGSYEEPVASEYADAATFICIPSSMALRDAIYLMNEVFATNALVADHQGRRLGWLTQSRIAELFASDADRALQSRCDTLLRESGIFFAA